MDMRLCVIIFKTPQWSKLKAILWLYNHQYMDNIYDDTTPGYMRFIQIPLSIDKTYINKKMDNGIEFVYSSI